MACQDYITESVERKKGQHLQREDRGAIQQLKNAGYTNRAIARAIGCSPTTVGNELKRGTPPRKSSKGRKPGYSARRGEAAYKANRKRSRKPHRICHCTRFIRWITEQVKEHKWSLDACVGYARLHRLFSAEEMVCTHTLYNEVWAGSLDLSVAELPEAMKRKQHKDSKPREHRKSFGTDISQRPEIAALRIEGGTLEDYPEFCVTAKMRCKIELIFQGGSGAGCARLVYNITPTGAEVKGHPRPLGSRRRRSAP